jgi:hypothetical protein
MISTYTHQASTVSPKDSGESPFAQRAFFYIEMGYSVVPIAPGTKRPGSWTEEHGWRGMHDWEQYNKRMPTDIELGFWDTWPGAGIGLLTGKLSGIVALDRDYNTDGTDALDNMIPYTPVKKRGAKGYTAFFRYRGERSCSFNVNGQRVLDVLSDGRQTLMPGTVHPDGPTYVYLTEDLLEETASNLLPALPDDFLDQVAALLDTYQTEADKRYQRKNIALPNDQGPLNQERSFAAQYWHDLNQAALAQLADWVPKLIFTAKPERGGYRSIATWRGAELPRVGIHPSGIFDFGGNYGMSPITLIMNANSVPFADAAESLRRHVSLDDPVLRWFEDHPITARESSAMQIEMDTPAAGRARPSYREDRNPKPAGGGAASHFDSSSSTSGTHITGAVGPVVTAGAREGRSTPPEHTEADLAFPEHLLNPPGVLKEFMDWILGCALKPQPILALATSLSIVATVLAQKVKSQTGLRTNLYLVSVADTSAGKDHGRKCLKNVFKAAGLENMLGGEELASGPGLMAAVGRQPCAVFQLDEFGLMLKSIRSANAGAHLQQIVTNLMKLFTSAGTIVPGAEYADQKTRPRADIAYPCVNLHAATTPEPLFDAFGSGDVASGYLNRLLILFAPAAKFALRVVDIADPPAKLVEWMMTARRLQQGEFVGVLPDDPIRIPMSEQADKLFRELYEFEQDKQQAMRSQGLHHLWGRCFEHASKVALVVACAKHAEPKEFAASIARAEVVVDEDSARWAIDFVKHVLTRMTREVSSRVADSEFGQLQLVVENAIKKGGPRGLTERDLCRACSRFKDLTPQVRDQVLGALTRNESIVKKEFKPESGRGRGRLAFVAQEYADAPTCDEAEPE